MTMPAILQESKTDDDPITPVYRRPIDHPSAWKVTDFRSPADYTIELTATQLGDIEGAMSQVKAADLGLDDLQREHFELPSLRPVVDEIRHRSRRGAVSSSSAACRSRPTRKTISR